MPKRIAIPTAAEEAIAAAEFKRAALAAKLATAEARIRRLEGQRDDALASLERTRKARMPRRIAPPPARKRLRGDTVRVIFGDVHGLHCDVPAFTAMLGDVKRLNPHEVIIGGDGVNCGGFLAAKHTLGYVADTADTYEEDIAAANGHLDAIREAAPNARTEWIEGNHEDRVERWAVTEALRNRADAEFLRRLVSPATLLNLKTRGIPFHRRAECHDGLSIPGWIKRGKCFFTHQMSSARNAAAASVANTGGNLVFFHTHRQDFSPLVLPGVGLIAAWCPGCLCQRQPLWRHSSPTHWTHGYAVQLIARTGNFLHINVPIENGNSLAGGLLK